MSKDTESNLFMFSPLTEYARFYQRLLSGIASYDQLGNRITGEIKIAHAFRQVEKVRELARLLINLPVKEYQVIGQYYLVWCQCRELKYHNGALERIIEQTRTYKTKALISRAAFEGYKGNIESELYFYTEALKTQPTVSEYIDILKSIAVIKAKEGFHKSALKDLESIVPLIRHAEPLVYYDVLNSYSVELGEAGRVYEARNICRHVLASPFAFAYPEWHETGNEIALRGYKSRSVVSFVQPQPKNVVALPQRDAEATVSASVSGPAQILDYIKWKKKMGKEPNGNQKDDLIPQNLEDLSDKDIMVKIFQLSSQEGITREELLKILEYTIKVTTKDK